MKGIARSYCWWSGIDNDIKTLVENCHVIHKHVILLKIIRRKLNSTFGKPSTASMHRVHVDFAGPFFGHWFFIVVDVFLKWPEVRIIKNLVTKTVINEYRDIFTKYGIPRIFVTDNGRTFTSTEFKSFLKQNGVQFKYTVPYNPATNGQAERFVQTLKNALRCMNANTINIHEKLCKMLLHYRIAPHAITKKSPAELFLGRKLRTRLDLLFPIR